MAGFSQELMKRVKYTEQNMRKLVRRLNTLTKEINNLEKKLDKLIELIEDQEE